MRLLPVLFTALSATLTFVRPAPAQDSAENPLTGSLYVCSVALDRKALQSRIDGFIAHSSALANKQVGIEIRTAEEGHPVYSRQAMKPMIPASLVKLVTSAVALQELGQEFSYVTELRGTVSSDGRSIEGPLYLRGSGDPSLVTERMFLMAEQLAGQGIEKVTGDLIVDESYFDDVRFNPAWAGKETDESYFAATGALSVNFNSLTVVVHPSRKPAEPPVVFLEPITRYAEIINRARTVPPGQRSWVDAGRYNSKGGPQIVVGGKVAEGTPPHRLYLNLENPALYAGSLLEELLRRAGTTLEGKVREGTVPEEAPVLYESTSKPLALIVRDLNKYSNNFIAEQLVKTIGAHREGAPGTWEKGLAVMHDFLAGLGLPLGSWELYDGSGLSPKDRLSAEALVAVLRHMYTDPRIRPEYVASLPVGGTDGTVRRRFRDEALQKRVRAKTGHLNEASSLAGLLYPEGRRPLAFAILVNGRGAGSWDVRAGIDALVTEILEGCRAPTEAGSAKAP